MFGWVAWIVPIVLVVVVIAPLRSTVGDTFYTFIKTEKMCNRKQTNDLLIFHFITHKHKHTLRRSHSHTFRPTVVVSFASVFSLPFTFASMLLMCVDYVAPKHEHKSETVHVLYLIAAAREKKKRIR